MFLPVEYDMHTSIVDTGFLLNCVSWMSCCGSTWIALAVAVSVLVPVVLPYCNTPWQNDSSSDNVHMYSHMLPVVMTLARYVTPQPKQLPSPVPCFCSALLVYLQGSHYFWLQLSYVQTVFPCRLPASTFGDGIIQFF